MLTDLTTLTDAELLHLYHQKNDEETQYDSLQNAFKIALNSLYGACANQHFRYYNTNIAEGITLTGQCVIRFISNRINWFMNTRLKTDGVDYVVANDTDSVAGNTIIKTSQGDNEIQKVWDLTAGVIDVRSPDSFVKSVTNMSALAYDGESAIMKPVKYIMKHKVKKRMYRISLTMESGDLKSVICTCDHSLVVRRGGDMVEVSPAEVKENDIFIAIR